MGNLRAMKSQGQRKRAQQKAKLGGTQNTALQKNVETVIFQNPDVKKKDSTVRNDRSKSNDKGRKVEEPEMDMKKARYEVMKFNIKSMSGSEKVDAEAEFAMSLGARPEKRPFVNYKELTASRKIEIERQKAHDLINKKPKLKTKNDRKLKRRKNKLKKPENEGKMKRRK